MNPPAPTGGSIFHALLRSCLSEQRNPTDDEIDIVASKIWQDGFATASGKRWNDVQPHSQAHAYVRNAARMALGDRPLCPERN